MHGSRSATGPSCVMHVPALQVACRHNRPRRQRPPDAQQPAQRQQPEEQPHGDESDPLELDLSYGHVTQLRPSLLLRGGPLVSAQLSCWSDAGGTAVT